MTFTAIPAIDVRGGRVVRLNQGDFDRETIYENAPLEKIVAYAAQGATWLHLVDLDAARSGHYTLAPLLSGVRAETSLRIQTGGGVRSEDDVAAMFDAGASRVVIGTLAVKDPGRVIEWMTRLGSDRITLALDARADRNGVFRLPVRGWSEDSNETLFDLLQRYVEAGLRHLLCTDIARDGMLAGLNVDLYRAIALAFPAIEIQASGGVRSLDDIRSARDAGASAAILGRALLEGRFALKDALAC